MFVVETSSHCNNNCIFCMEPRDRAARGCTPEILRKAARDFSRVDFATGEPTLNPKLPEYVESAAEAGFSDISITTNGRMLAARGYAKRLVDAGLNKFKVSIHGPSAEIHDAMTRTPGSFRQTLAGIRNVSLLKEERDLTLTTLTTVTKLNYQSLPESLRLFLHFPVDNAIFNVFDPTGRAARMAETLMPRYSDVERSFRKAVEMEAIKSRGVSLSLSLPPCTLGKGMGRYYGNYEILAFNNDGELRTGQVRRGKTFLEKCRKCALRPICDGVWDKYVELYGGSEFEPREEVPRAFSPRFSRPRNQRA